MKKQIIVVFLALVGVLISLAGCIASDVPSKSEHEQTEISKYINEESGYEQTGTSKYINKESGEYTLTLPISQKTIKLNSSEDNFIPYISDALIEAAEKKITEDTAKYNDTPHFYLSVNDDGELYLAAEVIYYLDEPDENVGCYDHEHLFFSERISNRTGK